MKTILKAIAIATIAMLGLAACSSSTGEVSRAMIDDVNEFLPENISRAQEKNVEAWTRCMMPKIGLKNMRIISGVTPDADISDSDAEKAREADEECVEDLGLNPDEPWKLAD